MKIYIEEEFMNQFVQLPQEKSFGVKTLWNFVNSYAQILWFFDSKVDADSFQKWEYSNSLLAAITGKSHVKKANQNFKKLLEINTTSTKILFAAKSEDWHDAYKDKILIFTLDNFEREIENIAEKLSFYYSADQINGWKGLSAVSKIPANSYALIDKYIFDNYLQFGQEAILDNSFIEILKQIGVKQDQFVDVYTSVPKVSKSVSNFRSQLEDIYDIAANRTKSTFGLTVINTEVDKSFDFHDRNLFNDYCIVKIGTGFKSSFKKYTNTELEGYSIFEKKGYDMLRYRRRMLNEYWSSYDDAEIIIFEN